MTEKEDMKSKNQEETQTSRPESGDSIETMEAERYGRLYAILQGNGATATADDLRDYLRQQGILGDDPRLQKIRRMLDKHTRGKGSAGKKLSPAAFEAMLQESSILQSSFSRSFVIPEFETFCREIEEIYEQTRVNRGGHVADYIPQLSRVDPEHFAVSICTVDGQRFSLGDDHTKFCLQSTCKPVNYCLAIEELGQDEVHAHVGREPSGHSFNELSLNKRDLPHNPLINAGAIMCCSLIRRRDKLPDRFDFVSDTWRKLCGGKPVGFNNSVYLSERETADRNFALAYFMRENGAFPEGTDLVETLEFYFQCCSLESDTSDQAIAAATLANAGVNPLTGKRVFSATTVQHCLSLMLSCGMYDFSGEFAFRVGLPAKSGVSGAISLVIPNLMGIEIWSPALDDMGNSVRGVEFCERLIEKYSFHNFDALNRYSEKKNPRLRKYESEVNRVVNLIWAASRGDLSEVKRLHAEGVDLNMGDYDGRTALHLAAAENKRKVAEYLLNHGALPHIEDRDGDSPLDEAVKAGHDKMVGLLRSHGK